MKVRPDTPATRRAILGGAAVAGAAISAPFIRNAEAAETTTWKVQTSWPAGVGLNTFKEWAGVDQGEDRRRTGIQAFRSEGSRRRLRIARRREERRAGGDEFLHGLLGRQSTGDRLPVILPDGPALSTRMGRVLLREDGLKMAREIFAKQDLMYVGRIHHGPNIIHSKKPIRSIEDFKDLKLRVPGGMIAEGFAAIGAKTTLLPGGEVFSALEKGTIEAADYTGPAVNWDLGFQQVTKYIWMGPPGLESIYQPVDLMDFCVGMNHWNKLSPKMKPWVENEIEAYSALHHAAIQKADMEAWPKFIKAGTEINRLPVSDLEKFQRVAVPIWFKWANKDKDAARVFKAQLEVMESPTFGYVTPDMYEGQKLDL